MIDKARSRAMLHDWATILITAARSRWPFMAKPPLRSCSRRYRNWEKQGRIERSRQNSPPPLRFSKAHPMLSPLCSTHPKDPDLTISSLNDQPGNLTSLVMCKAGFFLEFSYLSKIHTIVYLQQKDSWFASLPSNFSTNSYSIVFSVEVELSDNSLLCLQPPPLLHTRKRGCFISMV